jgi:DNA-binding MarR family transcriptional regulator
MVQPATTVISSIHLLHRASQRADGLFARNVGAANLTPRQFAVLQALVENNWLSQTDIIAATGIRPLKYSRAGEASRMEA